MKIKRFLAVLGTITMMTALLTACNSKPDKSEEVTTATESITEAPTEALESEIKADISGQTIKWLCYYDINPVENGSRSIALTLFEDVYGGKVEWIPTTKETQYDDLSKMILSGNSVDMFPFEYGAVPEGVSKNLFQPLDEYINFEDELWSDVKGLADKLKYNNQYYIVPYSISDPVCIMYSRQMIQDEGLDDPYELYKSGKWDWDAFTSMMKTFTEGDGGDITRYGCAGKISLPILQSTGQTLVNYDGTKFTNNIMSPEIEKAGILLEEISDSGLYNPSWHTYFPNSGSTLFYGMDTWALPESNGRNPESDIFLVPFPKMTGSNEHYISCSFDAKMLVKGSENAEAVARYLECERIAVTNEEYKSLSDKKALTTVVNTGGDKLRYVTEEQWDMWQSLINCENVTPVFDFGYGMSSKMTAQTNEYSTTGAMHNLADALIKEPQDAPSTWTELRDSWKTVIDEEIAKYN